MSERLATKRVLVTGGGSGICLAIVRRFIDEGATVSVCDLNPESRAQVESLGARFDVVDVADVAAVEGWVQREITALGGVDVVVAGAGYELVAKAGDLTVEQWDHQMAVMLRGPFVTFRAALPAMVEAGRGGSLIALSSQVAFAGITGYTAYAPAKRGLIGLVRVLAIDYAQYGIRVNAVCPGPTDTPMIQRQLDAAPDPAALLRTWQDATLLGRLGQPDEIASGAVYLASDESGYVTGSALMIDGGYTVR
ncbi:SDR family NAD(P)-dependent oxidoreductase [Cellulomonas fengjieae]|uniref:SDR family NAD(P)-dependent oxidoreductase n=1 Tax=Cellulomonas fengjieae TaxID=2819978 RepID=UPI001AAEC79F|nr:SDR family oxidoreductase [Cellulomonas fengjieae]MBO3103706.1 SDR family oxidoreductase [Cellulomonas fengjieae]